MDIPHFLFTAVSISARSSLFLLSPGGKIHAKFSLTKEPDGLTFDSKAEQWNRDARTDRSPA